MRRHRATALPIRGGWRARAAGWVASFALTVVIAGFAVPDASARSRSAVEYRHAEWNHYFVTAFPEEIARLDAGEFGAAWQRTGESFEVFDASDQDALPTCRFFSRSFAPRSSHFYTPFASECAALAAGADWAYEGIAFHLAAVDANGSCAGSGAPLYRLYNNGDGGAPNHRYTTRAATRDEMLLAGWTPEGHGATSAFACVPQVAPTAGNAAPSRVEQFSFRGYGVSVYLPSRYDAVGAPLPVIYAFDAEQRFARLTQVLEAGNLAIVLVGIGQLSGAQRFVDFDLPGATVYFTMLTQELIPHVERRYRVDPGRRTLSGHSLSGFFTLLAMLLEEPADRLFQSYIVADGSFQFSQAATTGLMREAYRRDPVLAVKLVIAASRGGAGLAQEMAVQLRRNFSGLTIFERVYSEDHVGMDVPSFYDALPFVYGE